jgi:hypothetical protein
MSAALGDQDLEWLADAGHLDAGGTGDLTQLCQGLLAQELMALVLLLGVTDTDVRGQMLVARGSVERLLPLLPGEPVAPNQPLECWVRDVAEQLNPEQRETVLAALRRPPTSRQCLALVRGIGARRLDRCYEAGLYTVEGLSAAPEEEVAQVTGLPLRVVRSLMAAARSHAEAGGPAQPD